MNVDPNDDTTPNGCEDDPRKESRRAENKVGRFTGCGACRTLRSTSSRHHLREEVRDMRPAHTGAAGEPQRMGVRRTVSTFQSVSRQLERRTAGDTPQRKALYRLSKMEGAYLSESGVSAA
jgi:hypothetical protein